MQYAGRIFASKVQRFQDLVPLLLHRTGLPEGTPLLIYEEVKFEPQLMCDLQNMAHTLAQAQLEDGDILCLQAELTEVRGLSQWQQVLIAPRDPRGHLLDLKWGAGCLELPACQSPVFTLPKPQSMPAHLQGCSVSSTSSCMLRRNSSRNSTLMLTACASQEERASLPYPTVKDYLEWVRKRITVTFRRLEHPKVPSPLGYLVMIPTDFQGHCAVKSQRCVHLAVGEVAAQCHIPASLSVPLHWHFML